MKMRQEGAPTHYGVIWLYVGIILLTAGVILLLAGCDTGARKDLPQENQNLDSTDATIYLFPDRFPNIAHKCDSTTGFWTTTDRAVWIVYNDRLCGGTGQILVFSNIPGSKPESGGGE